METEAAILWNMGDDWKVETIRLDPPKADEVLVPHRRIGHVPQRRAFAHPATSVACTR